MRPTECWVVVLVAQLGAAPAAWADEAGDNPAARFQLALRLHAQGNKEQAVVELERLLAIEERASVLFNLAIIYGEVGRPQDSLRLSDRALARADLPADRRDRLRVLRGEVRQKLGEVRVQAPLEGVEVELGGRRIGVTPLEGPVLANAGSVVLSARKPQFEPFVRSLEVPAGGGLEVTLELTPTALRFGTIVVRSSTPGAGVFIDGVRVGVTPALVRAAVLPGTRTVSLRREGYRSAEQTVSLAEGAEVEVELEPTPDTDPARVAELAVTSSEEQVTVTVDGRRAGLLGKTPLELPPGPHLLVFERGGFFPIRRRVELTPAGRERLELVFEPTPALRGELLESRRVRRTLGVVGLGVGGAGAVASVAYLAGYLLPEEQKWLRQRRQAEAEAEARTGCFADPRPNAPSCEQLIDQANQRVSEVRTLQALGVATLVTSGLLAVGGLISMLLAPDLSRYERPPATLDLIEQLALVPVSGGGAVLVGGRF